MSAPACTVCGETRWLPESHGAGGLNDVCRPCFYIWYDGVSPRSDGRVHGDDIFEFRRKAVAERSWPFQAGSEFDVGVAA